MLLSYNQYRETFTAHRGIQGVQGGSVPRPISPSKEVIDKAQHTSPEINTLEELQVEAEHFKILITKRNNKFFISGYKLNPPIELKVFSKFDKAKEYLEQLIENNVKSKP